MTKKEIKAWKKLGVRDANFCTIFMPIFGEIDGHIKTGKNQRTFLMTTEKSELYKHRKMIMKRFPGKFKIVGPEEALKLMEKAQKDGKKI